MTSIKFGRCAWLLGAGLPLVLAGGCHEGNETGPDRHSGGGSGKAAAATQPALKDTESVVLGVYSYYRTPIPWRWTEDKSRVHGLIVSALFLQGSSGKGVFGDGIIHPKLYVRDRTVRDLDQQWKLAKEWSFTPQDMYPMRSAERTVQGYGYMLPLDWGDLDLSGHEIRVVIAYEPTNGMPAPRPSVKDLVVPMKGA